ncbi:sensor histidine kinase KdpD [Tistrella sp. BH-R2-4]|uniref:histidine kinase n=1 Tax=Tistrella arctica TaxID=3133430 RepID=A0ABU9YJR2_9PROT
MSHDPEAARPAPDALIDEAGRARRGRLKVFLGAAPGVGKTYAMLEEAQRRRVEGVDVVVAVVEGHGRAETEALVRGLEVVPRRMISHRGRPFSEMDLDAVLARRPALALVDEFAHTNIPGSRHEKRYQDVRELIDAGIDVLTTLNIQHLDSLNDIVQRITRIRVRETLPDDVLAMADEIELIDLPPDDLIRRLRDGKVYLGDQARRAVAHFFSRGNLTALRELALRAAAERVDDEMIRYMRAHAVPGPWPARERLMVCVGPGAEAESVVRAARRMADRSRMPWIAVHVETSHAHGEDTDDTARDRANRALRLAERLGAEVAVLPRPAHSRRMVDDLLALARDRNVSRILVGRAAGGSGIGRRVRQWLHGGGLAAALLRRAAGFDLTVIAADPGPEDGDNRDERLQVTAPPASFGPQELGLVGMAVGGAVAVAAVVETVLPLPNLSLVFLIAVLVVAIRGGLWPSIAASIASFVAYNFFFTAPYHTLAMSRTEDILTIVFFLIAATLTGNLAGRLRERVQAEGQAARRVGNLYDFARKAAGAANIDDVAWAVVSHVARTLQCDAVLLLPDTEAEGGLRIGAGFPPEDRLTPANRAAAEWAWRHGRPAGWSSDTLPASDWLFVPMQAARGPVGLVGVSFSGGQRPRSLRPDQRQLLEAVVDQAALAVDRTNLAADIEAEKLKGETDALRAALLSSISHDLRTPLVSIIGAASSLKTLGEALTPAERGDLADTVHDEARRLDAYVQNLLDMTRLGHGALEPRRDWVDLADLVGRVRQRLRRLPDARRLEVRIDPDLPLLHVDGALIEQVLVNLVDNAIKYGGPDGAITIRAGLVAAAGGAPVDIGRADIRPIDIRVEDDGPGIPPADREAVFDMFHRVRAGDAQPAGTGLGLAICRGFVEAHGGRITAGPATADGRGTAITIRLPAPAPPAPPPPDEGAGAGEGEGGDHPDGADPETTT